MISPRSAARFFRRREPDRSRLPAGIQRSWLRGILALGWGLLAVAAARGGPELTFNWRDNADNETGFRIERSTDGTNFQTIATVAANITSYLDANLPGSTTFWYRVRAFNYNAESAPTTPVSITTPAAPPANTAPTITAFSDQQIVSGSNTGLLPFTIGDAETPAGQLTLSVGASNQTLVPLANIVISGSGANRALKITPASGRTGSSTISVRVSDGSLHRTSSFVLSVIPNTAPTISALNDRTLITNSGGVLVPFTIGDAETSAANLTVTASASDAWLLPPSGILVSGGGANRTLLLQPAANRVGSTTVVVRVSDGVAETKRSFLLTVLPVPAPAPDPDPEEPTPDPEPGDPISAPDPGEDPSPPANVAPMIGAIADAIVERGTTKITRAFSVSDLETHASLLAISFESSNPKLVPSQNIVLGGSGAERTLSITPVPGCFGSTTISVRVSDGTSESVRSFVISIPAGGRPINLSTRVRSAPGAPATVGFVVQGVEPRRVLLRAVGPALRELFDLPRTLPNPRLTLLRWNGTAYEELAENRDWHAAANASAVSAAMAEVFAFALPGQGRDAALLIDLPPGQYTARAEDESASGAGTTLVEIYEVSDSGDTGRFINLSTRGLVGTGSDVMIGGFVLSDETPTTVLIRAVGPGLERFGVSHALSNPMIEVYRHAAGQDTLIAMQDDWESGEAPDLVAAAAEQVWAFTLKSGSRDAALLETFPSGIYTVVVRGVGNTTGEALLEIYTISD